MKGIGGHQSASMETDTWLTPPEIISSLGPFDLDPCTPEFMPWETAAHRFTKNEDGLKQPWSGRVWLNPPYSREVGKWMKKLAEHGRGTALIFARTETESFVNEVWAKASALLFIHGRIHFHFPDGSRAKTNSGAPSVLVAYGMYDALMLQTSGIKGTYVYNFKNI